MIVYCYTNKINDKKYIGITSRSLEEREKSHLYEAYNKNSLTYNVPFKRAIRKYGIDNFDKVILCNCNSFDEACEKEKFYIKKYKTYYKYKNSNGYNATTGGDYISCPKDRVYQIDINTYNTVNIFGSIYQAEHEYGRGILEHCRNIDKKGSPFGYCWYLESDYLTFDKDRLRYEIDCIRLEKVIQLSLKGEVIKIWDSMKTISEELNISQGNISEVCNYKRCSAGGYVFMLYKEYIDKGFIMKESNEDRSKKVYQLDLNNNFIASFKSMTEASTITGINLTSISQCCNNKRNHAGGYKWTKHNNK